MVQNIAYAGLVSDIERCLKGLDGFGDKQALVFVGSLCSLMRRDNNFEPLRGILVSRNLDITPYVVVNFNNEEDEIKVASVQTYTKTMEYAPQYINDVGVGEIERLLFANSPIVKLAAIEAYKSAVDKFPHLVNKSAVDKIITMKDSDPYVTNSVNNFYDWVMANSKKYNLLKV